MRTRVKICGLTRPGDVEMVANAGADAIGLVFHAASPRAVQPHGARELVRVLPPFVSSVALFVDPAADEVRRVLGEVGPDLLQFHGSEDEAFCAQFGVPFLKVLRVGQEALAPAALAAYPRASALLLDTLDPRRAGGSGRSFDWSLVPRPATRRFVLAGGLHAGNVAQAIAATHPWAVDVSSGVEREPGRKDRQKVEQFMRVVAGCDRAGEQQTGDQDHELA